MKRVKLDALLNDDKLRAEFYNEMKAGAVAVIPTDTLYGFAVDADSDKAVKRVYEIKGREANKPFILFVNKLEELSRLGISGSDFAGKILSKYWPGALTGILNFKKSLFLKAFTHETIGVRIPGKQKLLELMEKYHGYWLTTSANKSQSTNLSNPDEIAQEFASQIDWLIDDGFLKDAEGSTIVNFTLKEPVVLRQGKLIIAEVDK